MATGDLTKGQRLWLTVSVITVTQTLIRTLDLLHLSMVESNSLCGSLAPPRLP
ncbi:hypothetical protein ES708_08481 [subsurface metagenome]